MRVGLKFCVLQVVGLEGFVEVASQFIQILLLIEEIERPIHLDLSNILTDIVPCDDFVNLSNKLYE